MQYRIDRFEGDFAILELDAGKFTEKKRTLLPENAKEGDLLEECNGKIFFASDSGALKRQVQDLEEELFKK